LNEQTDDQTEQTIEILPLASLPVIEGQFTSSGMINYQKEKKTIKAK
jgi:hypothetical protein